jgi:hypothetical protein
VPIGIRERAGVAPWLRSGAGDEVGTLGNGTSYERVGIGFRSCSDDEDAFVVAGRRDLAVADGSPETSTRGEQNANTGVDDELQRLRDTVVGRLSNGLEAERAAVEVVGRRPVCDGKADHDGFVGHRALLMISVAR